MFKKLACIIIGLFLFIMTGCSSMMKTEMKFSLGKYEEVIPMYQQELEANPDAVQARSRLGVALLKTNRLEESITEFEKVLVQEPGDPYTILHLGLAYLKLRSFDKAIQTWRIYRNEEMPIVEREIKRQITIVSMVRAQDEAKKALEAERKIGAETINPNTIAVGYFKDLSPDKSFQAFQKGLNAMLITDISKIKDLVVVEREQIQALLEEMKMGLTGIVDEKTAPRVGKLLGAEHMVTGTLSHGSIEAAIAVASASTGDIKGVASASINKDKFFELSPVIINNIAKILKIELSRKEIKDIGIPHTKSYNAFVLYGNALDALDRGDWQEARNACDLALREAPAFIPASDCSDSAPGKFAPSIESIKRLDMEDIIASVETSLDNAFIEQAKALKELEGQGGGGGH
jgi:tetratricopeptide (TPR) repeat protein